jgi:carboxyl-terminal processing protease
VPAEGDTAEAGTLKLLRGDELTARLEGWVGLFVNRRSSQIVVAGVSPWTPADEAHLEVGDQLVSIDGRDVTGLGPRAVTYLLRGRVGTSVAVVVREHGGQRRKLTLARVVR